MRGKSAQPARNRKDQRASLIADPHSEIKNFVLALFLQHSSKLASIVKAATSSVKTTARSPSKALPLMEL
jgi:hypothetical protein